MGRIRRKLIWLFKRWAWELEGKPKTKAVPLYRTHKLVAYDEFLLNQIGEIYIDVEGSEETFGNVKRRIILFDAKALDSKSKPKLPEQSKEEHT